MQLRALAIVAVSAALLGCPTLIRPLPIQIHASGTWEHPASGLSFPEQIGSYRRVSIDQFNPSGTDIGVGYNYESDSASVAFTVYVFPPRTLQSGVLASPSDAFEIEKQVIHSHHPDAQDSWMREEPFVRAGGPVLAKAAEFRYTEDFAFRRQAVISQMYLFALDRWSIKYRLTFAAVQEEQAREVARQMLSNAPWGRRAS